MSVNKVILIGNVGRDPDVKYFDNGSVVANFTLATTERGYTATNGTQVPERTEWHNIVCWRGLAKIAEQYVKKGTQVYIEGKLRSRSYDDANGAKRYVVEIYADNMELMSRKKDEYTGGVGANNETAASHNPIKTESNIPQNTITENDEMDDLPF